MQWHAEALADRTEDAALFRAFVEAAREAWASRALGRSGVAALPALGYRRDNGVRAGRLDPGRPRGFRRRPASPPRRGRASEAELEDPRIAELEARKEAKYREIRDAEMDHAQGKLTEADFRRQDAELRARGDRDPQGARPGRGGALMPRRPDLPPLSRAQLREDPMEQFAAWFERALAEVPLAEAMSLATVDEAGRPDARMVLLKGFGPAGFRFFTNYESAKGEHLAAGARGGDRRLLARARPPGPGPGDRSSGSPPRTPTPTSRGRPRDAQIGAWASPQSQPIPSRGELDGLVDDAASASAPSQIPRPPHWGGYVLRSRIGRVLAGPGRPPARPLPLHPRRGRLADRAVGSVEGSERPRDTLSCAGRTP